MTVDLTRIMGHKNPDKFEATVFHFQTHGR